ncbi:TrmB family transcriptional regulator [Halorubellus sp. JP-L1]|nr:TrmB family transcriptional regulator [Halorubellus sp. JP-L1]
MPTALESTQAKLVYVYLEREREATVDGLASALDVPKLGLFTVLSTLEAAGYVERNAARMVRFAN